MTAQRRRRWWGLLVVAFLVRSCPVSAQQVLDGFEDLSGWSASASEGARVEIARDAGQTGMSLRIDFDLGAGGYAIARKAFAITLPANYAFRFAVRGDAPPNNFEFKLVDRAGQNVWWYKQRGFIFPTEWREVTIKQSRIEFAWGPAGGGVLKQIAQIEFSISAGAGGRGSIWIDDLRLEEREVAPRVEPPPKVTASTSLPDHEPQRILDQDPQTSWRSGSLAADQWVLFDFQRRREYGGLVIDWDPDDYATSYHVETSDNGETWTTAYGSQAGNGGRDYIYMPDAESRYLRLHLEQSSRGQGYAIRTLTVKPLAFSASPNQFFEAIAADAPAGTYPKYFSGRQTYWTVIGANGDDKEALLNEEGMLEVDKGAFSVEPFLFADGTLITWNSVRTAQHLERGYLPIPSVNWEHERLPLTVTVVAAGQAGASILYARYRIENRADRYADAILFLAIRPFQVLPPWQSLNMVGGVTPVRDILFDARSVWVNGEKAAISLNPPDRFGAATFEEGPVTDFLAAGKVPQRTQLSDPFGYASGALQYSVRLEPGAHADVYLAIPFHNPELASATIGSSPAASDFETQLGQTARYWETELGCVDLRLPPAAVKIAQTLKSTLAYILINNDGPAIQPGSRNYERSWIRDGALTSAALLEMGFTAEVREFIRWFAQYQFADGKIPCCVDRRGGDPVPEHDSNGEFIYTVAEYYRFTHDVGFLNEMWPAVVRAVDYLVALRQQRLSDVYKRPGKEVFFGLLPESISHEGYASRPVHSYWDDFFALRGFKDAAGLAVAVADEEHAARFAALRDEFRRDLYASIARSMADHQIDYIPGSAELGDFDPNSTAIAATLGSELRHLPQPALSRTFDRYYEEVQARRQRKATDEAYTPYELRNVDVFIRLGQRDRAHDLLETILADQRPPAWNQWPEVLWRDPTMPKFIGDMPHTWVAAGFVRAVRSMFVYEREGDRALVVAAGVPLSWLASDSGVAVKRLPTHYGVLSYSLRSEGANTYRLQLSGDLTVPPGKIVLQPPLPQPLIAASVNGQRIESFTADSATISELPADVVLQYGSGQEFNRGAARTEPGS